MQWARAKRKEDWHHDRLCYWLLEQRHLLGHEEFPSKKKCPALSQGLSTGLSLMEPNQLAPLYAYTGVSKVMSFHVGFYPARHEASCGAEVGRQDSHL